MDHATTRPEERVQDEVPVAQLQHGVEGGLAPLVAPEGVDHVAVRKVDLAGTLRRANLQTPALSAMKEDLHHIGERHLAERTVDTPGGPRARARALLEQGLE